MRPGACRVLALTPDDAPEAESAVQVEGPLRATEIDTPGEGRRLRIEATGRGPGSVSLAGMRWDFVVRGAAHTPEQTRDDTDAGWGESRSGHSDAFWTEQRPPHW